MKHETFLSLGPAFFHPLQPLSVVFTKERNFVIYLSMMR
jgi:hypothetical protein